MVRKKIGVGTEKLVFACFWWLVLITHWFLGLYLGAIEKCTFHIFEAQTGLCDYSQAPVLINKQKIRKFSMTAQKVKIICICIMIVECIVSMGEGIISYYYGGWVMTGSDHVRCIICHLLSGHPQRELYPIYGITTTFIE